MQQFGLTDDLEYIKNVFIELDKLIKELTEGVAEESARTLHRNPIFPVKNLGDTEERSFGSLQAANSRTEWFIADSAHLARSFCGRLPLLAFSVGEIGRLKRVFKAANAEMRKLSNVVESNAQRHGTEVPWPAYQESLRDKANYILRYVVVESFKLLETDAF